MVFCYLSKILLLLMTQFLHFNDTQKLSLRAKFRCIEAKSKRTRSAY